MPVPPSWAWLTLVVAVATALGWATWSLCALRLRGPADPGGPGDAGRPAVWRVWRGVHRKTRLTESSMLVACLSAALGAAVGWSTTELRAQARLAQRLPAALEARDLVVTGVVAQLPRETLQGTRFLLDVESAALQGAAPGAAAVALPPLLSLAWYRGAEPDALLLGPSVHVKAGQRWRFTVRLKQPHGSFNPGGFDLELWLFERGIGATGYVRSRPGDVAVLLEDDAAAPVQRLRQWVRDAIERRLGAPAQARVAGVITALAIGDQAAIEREDWEVFRLTGVAHLMSISGLHVTMFAWLAGGLVGWLWRFAPRAMLWRPAPAAARWGGVALATAYALVAGWGVPAQRTVWMLATLALLHSIGRRWPLHAVLLAVAAVVVMADPWALLQPGFWLSFVAVALLAASQPPGGAEQGQPAGAAFPAMGSADAAGAPGLARRAGRQFWQVARGALRTQAVATAGLAPLTLVFFQQVSVVGFLANLVAIPVVTLLVTPLALLGALVPPLWDVAALLLSSLGAVLQWLVSWPVVVWHAAAAPAWAMAAGLFGGLVAVLPLPWRLRVLALPLMLPLLAPPVVRPAEGQFELVALDVGQGTAVLVRTRHHLLVYDTGPAFSPEADAGSRLLVPLLRWRGERQVDHLLLSHRDTDHVGGAGSLLAALPVRAVSSSLDVGHPLVTRALAAGATHMRCEAGQRWQWDGVHFEVLHPSATDHAQPGLRPNALSCVLRVTGAGGAAAGALLTGDIEAPQEARLAAVASMPSMPSAAVAAPAAGAASGVSAAAAAPAEPASALRAGFMLVPHHGSRTSSSDAFVDAVAPQVVLVQAGYRSRFGHPAPDVAARYERRGIALLRSDRCGALTWRSDASLRCERPAARRYWHHPAAP
ncbi:MAG: ComEC/Rec2 family competence protein [Rubrivivax sp.]|nr:ComEC/Rec2 family competence protein [Rubrivivax sp.]